MAAGAQTQGEVGIGRAGGEGGICVEARIGEDNAGRLAADRIGGIGLVHPALKRRVAGADAAVGDVYIVDAHQVRRIDLDGGPGGGNCVGP